MTKVHRRLPPEFAFAAVPAEGRIVRLQILRIHLLDGLRYLAMENLPLKHEEPVVDHLTDSLMGEVQSLSDSVENTPPHELLDAFGSIANAEPSGSLKNREFEFAADNGRHRCQLLGALAQSLQTPSDHLAD